jgi:ABC-type multidrug transport system permease subunit
MRHPISLYKKTGLVGFMGIQFFLGAPVLIFLISPIMWILFFCFILGILEPPTNMHEFFYVLMNYSIYMLLTGFFLQILQAFIAVRKNKWKNMWLSIVIFPFYWLLHSIASFKALWQLITKPFYWEKTNHGETEIIH